MGVAEFAFGVAASLLANVIQSITTKSTINYFQQRRLDNRIDEAISMVIEPMLTSLQEEGIPEEMQIFLMEVCEEELRPIADDPQRLFEGSLNGQKIFDQFYENEILPERITQAGLSETYAIIFPRIATLLCKIPVAVKDWESSAWAENFKRLDELAVELQKVFQKVDALTTSKESQKNTILSSARRALAQRLAIQLDLTGLRGEKPIAGKFDDFFVHPQIKLFPIKDQKNTEEVLLSTEEQALSQFSSIQSKAIIYGSPGAGKSTWTQWLQRKLLGESWEGLPVRQELRNLKIHKLPSIQQLVRDAAGIHHSEEITNDVINRWLEQNQVIFILDGLDEIHESKRRKLIQWIKGLALVSKNAPILITSRPLITNHLNNLAKTSWGKWEILPFNKERIIDYMGRWYRNVPLAIDENETIDIQVLADNWQSDSTIEPLTSNPLLLSTLLMVHHLDGRLPTGRAKLYQRYVDGLLGIWDDRRKIKANSLELSLESKKQILRNFALQLQHLNIETLEEGQTVEVIQNSLKELGLECDAQETLDLLRERSGLIIGPGIYSFIHKSVGEYLVAESIVQGDQRTPDDDRIDRLYLFNHRNDDLWNNIIFLWAGLAPISDVEAFINTCNQHKELSLAYGLLYDQYDRFSPKIKKKIFLDLFNYEVFSENENYFMYIGTSHPKKYNKALTFYGMNLRGILSHISIQNLCFLLEKDRILKSDVLNKTDSDIEKVIWYILARITQDIDEWKKISQIDHSNWLPEYVFLFVLADMAFLKKENQELYLEAIPALQQKPELIILSALSNILYSSGRLNHRHIKSNDELITKRFEVLAKMVFKYRHTKISNTLLKETLSWNMNHIYFEKNKDGLDLIKNVKSVLKKIIKIEENNLYIELDEYLTHLLSERDKIIDIEVKESS